MLKQELENLTGKNFTEEEFELINETFLSVVGINKERFAKEFLEMENNSLFQEMMKVIFYKNSLIERKKKENEQLAEFLINQSICHSRKELTKKAIEISGFEKVITYKIRKGYNLDAEELNYIAAKFSK